MMLGKGHFVAIYWRWVDGLSHLRLTGISVGPWFTGIAAETRGKN